MYGKSRRGMKINEKRNTFLCLLFLFQPKYIEELHEGLGENTVLIYLNLSGNPIAEDGILSFYLVGLYFLYLILLVFVLILIYNYYFRCSFPGEIVKL
jgi:hypothetical protein